MQHPLCNSLLRRRSLGSSRNIPSFVGEEYCVTSTESVCVGGYLCNREQINMNLWSDKSRVSKFSYSGSKQTVVCYEAFIALYSCVPRYFQGTLMGTLVLEVFLDFSPWERREVAITSHEAETSAYLESHFHADATVRIWPSGSDWLIFLQTRKSIWLVRSISSNTVETAEILDTFRYPDFHARVRLAPFWIH